MYTTHDIWKNLHLKMHVYILAKDTPTNNHAINLKTYKRIGSVERKIHRTTTTDEEKKKNTRNERPIYHSFAISNVNGTNKASYCYFLLC